ncbi:MAG: 50S ribosomal protein L29 [Thermodesulfobacteriota bacterium]|nr:MAG: 50S ribosomal protein L29 [Thermodesulfobacteriota bacterium]
MKPAEIREMTVDDIRAKVEGLKKDLFSLRMRHCSGQLENPIKLRMLKRDVARVMTILAEKEKGA